MVYPRLHGAPRTDAGPLAGMQKALGKGNRVMLYIKKPPQFTTSGASVLKKLLRPGIKSRNGDVGHDEASAPA